MTGWHDTFFDMISFGNELRKPISQDATSSTLHGMTMIQLYAIQYIATYEERGVFQKDLENVLKIRRSSVSSLLNKLEQSGFIVRVAVPEDARLKRLLLTEHGRALSGEIIEIHLRIENYVKSILTEEEAASLTAIMKKLCEGMAARAEER